MNGCGRVIQEGVHLYPCNHNWSSRLSYVLQHGITYMYSFDIIDINIFPIEVCYMGIPDDDEFKPISSSTSTTDSTSR